MDNKLSELSKPAAWVLHTRGGDVTTMDEFYVANAEGMENIRSSSLYSQEYVSALLADSEAQPSITDEAIDIIVVPLSLDGLDEEKHHCEWHLYHDRERIRKELREYFTAPPVPAVPDELVEEPDTWKTPDVVFGWNACRAAMLAQPVSQGYKLVPVEVLATASTLIDLCRTYTILQDTGSYKERTINDCENTMEVIDGLLAAAPEGGN